MVFFGALFLEIPSIGPLVLSKKTSHILIDCTNHISLFSELKCSACMHISMILYRSDNKVVDLLS